MNTPDTLPVEFVPRPFRAVARSEAVSSRAILLAQTELAARADDEVDRMYGYFPGSDDQQGDLPNAEALANAWPVEEYNGQAFQFSWLRLATGLSKNKDNKGPGKFHLDANGGTGLGSPEEDRDKIVPTAEVWRILLNLHQHVSRTVEYIDRPADQLSLTRTPDGSMIRLDDEPDETEISKLTIPPREQLVVHGAVICVSRVVHRGSDTNEGYFLGSWSKVA